MLNIIDRIFEITYYQFCKLNFAIAFHLRAIWKRKRLVWVTKSVFSRTKLPRSEKPKFEAREWILHCASFDCQDCRRCQRCQCCHNGRCHRTLIQSMKINQKIFLGRQRRKEKSFWTGKKFFSRPKTWPFYFCCSIEMFDAMIRFVPKSFAASISYFLPFCACAWACKVQSEIGKDAFIFMSYL